MQVNEHQGNGLKYLTVEPDGYSPGEQYPVVILLHGYGANMQDLAGLCPAIDRHGYVYVCPNAPMPLPVGLGVMGYAWTPRREDSTPDDGRRAEELIGALLDEVMERYRVEAGGMVLAGFSQGGMMTFRCGLTRPDAFAGLVVLSSTIADSEDLRLRLPPDRGRPIFMAHGTADPLISVEEARESVRFLQAEGYGPEYREYSMAHEISQDVLDDLVPWLRGVLPPVQAEGGER